jgi:hypothetical protein
VSVGVGGELWRHGCARSDVWPCEWVAYVVSLEEIRFFVLQWGVKMISDAASCICSLGRHAISFGSFRETRESQFGV